MSTPAGYRFEWMAHVDSPVYSCVECGAMTMYTDLHSEWHDRITLKFYNIEYPLGMLA